jgi:hypothetical protein
MPLTLLPGDRREQARRQQILGGGGLQGGGDLGLARIGASILALELFEWLCARKMALRVVPTMEGDGRSATRVPLRRQIREANTASLAFVQQAFYLQWDPAPSLLRGRQDGSISLAWSSPSTPQRRVG